MGDSFGISYLNCALLVYFLIIAFILFFILFPFSRNFTLFLSIACSCEGALIKRICFISVFALVAEKKTIFLFVSTSLSSVVALRTEGDRACGLWAVRG